MTTREKYQDIRRRLREHDAARKIIEGELLALQHACEHPAPKRWQDSGWGRTPTTRCWSTAPTRTETPEAR